MICDGCCYYDYKDNVCIHGSPIFDINDNCTDYIEGDYIKRIRAEERAKVLDEFANWLKEKGIHGSKEYTRIIRMYEDELKEQSDE